MKIGPLDSKPVGTQPAERKTAPAAAETRPEPSAQVQLSSAASSLSTSASDPTFDSAKVDRIAQAIRDGKYKVNPEAIADKLIVNAAELLGSKPN
jgi:negative regulator of flagellin synthesis FlgM